VDEQSYQFEAINHGSREWEIRLTDSAIHLREIDGSSMLEIPRTDLPGRTQVDRLERSSLLTFSLEEPLTLEVPADFLTKFEQWRGPLEERDLRGALMRRMAPAVPLAIPYLILGVQTSELHYDAVAAGFGVAAVVLFLLRQVWVSRTLFLLHAVWYFGAAVEMLLDVWAGTSWIFVPFALFMAWFGASAIRDYGRFKPSAMATASTA
jgi:hypothetical protein